MSVSQGLLLTAPASALARFWLGAAPTPPSTCSIPSTCPSSLTWTRLPMMPRLLAWKAQVCCSHHTPVWCQCQSFSHACTNELDWSVEPMSPYRISLLNSCPPPCVLQTTTWARPSQLHIITHHDLHSSRIAPSLGAAYLAEETFVDKVVMTVLQAGRQHSYSSQAVEPFPLVVNWPWQSPLHQRLLHPATSMSSAWSRRSLPS